MQLSHYCQFCTNICYFQNIQQILCFTLYAHFQIPTLQMIDFFSFLDITALMSFFVLFVCVVGSIEFSCYYQIVLLVNTISFTQIVLFVCNAVLLFCNLQLLLFLCFFVVFRSCISLLIVFRSSCAMVLFSLCRFVLCQISLLVF